MRVIRIFFVGALLACALLALPTAVFSQLGTVRVDAKANIFAVTSDALSDGQPPTIVRLPPGRNRSVMFTGVTGVVSCCQGNNPNGPEGGGTYVPTEVTSSHPGMSDVIHGSQTMFLAAAFVGDEVPRGNAPHALVYPGPETKPELSPLLNQVFFVGDGLVDAGGGPPQRFVVPDGATRILLGFADSAGFSGAAAAYPDNTGKITLKIISAKMDQPEFARWMEYTTGEGPTLSQTSNQWQVTIPGGATGEQISGGFALGCRLRGDFDIQVEFRLDNWPGENGVRVGFGTNGASLSRFSLGKDEYGDEKPRERYAMDFGGGKISFADASDSAGRFRLTRIGSELTGYYWSVSSWVPLRSGAVTPDDIDIAFGLHTRPNFFGQKTVSASFENFVVNHGECVTAKSPKPELASIEIIKSESDEPLDEIAIGDSFRVRLTYASEPGTNITEIVTISTPGSGSEQVVMKGSSPVIISGPITVTPVGR